MPHITKPNLTEYKPFYQGYMDKMAGTLHFDLLQTQVESLRRVYSSISENQIDMPQEQGKWSYNQLFGHLLDTEKIMHFRALMIARQPGVTLPGFDQDVYVAEGNFVGRTVFSESMDGLALNRQLIRSFLTSLTEKQLMHTGEVDGHSMSVRALIFIICGHMQHHLDAFYRSRSWIL